jgi:hypothetical protein
MSRICLVCGSDHRLEIDRQIIQGKSRASISRKYGISEASLSAHKQNHLSRQLAQAVRQRDALEGLNLLSEIEELLTRTKSILTKAEKKKKYTLALSAIRELRGTYELLSKIAFALHSARLAELEVEREKSGEAERERELASAGRLAILSNAELDLFEQLLEKIENQSEHTIIVPHRGDEVFFNASMLSTPEDEPEEDPDPLSPNHNPPPAGKRRIRKLKKP